MTSNGKEELETQNNSKNEWQMVGRTKRKKIHGTQQNTPEINRKTQNRYGFLTNEINQDFIDGNPNSTKIHKSPLIFVRGVLNYGEMTK